MRKIAAAAAIGGGLIWMTTVVITALRPIGYQGAHRSTLDLHPLILVAFVLMAWSATALAQDLQPSRLARAGAVASWIAVALFSVNVAVVLATGDDAPVWPTHYAAFFFIALGMSLLAVAALRLGALPVAATIAMIVAPLPMPLGNMQDDSVLLWLPLGVGHSLLGSRWRSRAVLLADQLRECQDDDHEAPVASVLTAKFPRVPDQEA